MLSNKQRVANGSAWLDQQMPGWRDQITDLDNLDIADGCRCILGQTMGWVEGVNQFYWGTNRGAGDIDDYGFLPNSGLNQAWKKAIHKTRASVKELTHA